MEERLGWLARSTVQGSCEVKTMTAGFREDRQLVAAAG